MSGVSDGWTPAFPGQRPPLNGPVGNQLALKHGAYSPRKVDPLATELVELVRADASVSWLTAADMPAVWAWARAEAQVQLLTEYLELAGQSTGDGVGDLEAEAVRSAYLLLHRAEARAMSGRRRLGLDPLSRARLGRDVAATNVDLARLLSEARESAELVESERGEAG